MDAAAAAAALGAIERALMDRALSAPEAMRAAHPHLLRVLDAGICLFGIYHRDSQSLEIAWQTHAGEELPGGAFPLGNGFTSRVVRTSMPLLIGDWHSEGPRVQVQYAAGGGSLPRSSATAPACVGGLVRGVLSVQSYAPDAYTSTDLEFLTRVADLVASAVFGPHKLTGAAAPSRAGNHTEETPGLLVLDERGRLVQVNQAARRLLCADGRSLIFGHPVSERQGQNWPLGTQAMTEALRPVLGALSQGEDVTDAVRVELDGGVQVMCSGSLLRRNGAGPCTRLELRRITSESEPKREGSLRLRERVSPDTCDGFS